MVSLSIVLGGINASANNLQQIQQVQEQQEQQEQIYSCIENIDNVFFEKLDNTYYIKTMNDQDGGFWLLDIFSANVENKEIEKQLNNVFKNRQVKIYYYTNEFNEIELYDYEILN